MGRKLKGLLKLSFWMLLFLPIVLRAEKTALLLVSHGSPSKEWNSKIVELTKEVSENLKKDNAFTEIGYAFMEFGKPSISEKIVELEKGGIERIVIMPIFIALSTHTCYDLLAILGILRDPETVEGLEEEGISLLRDSKIGFLIGPTLDRSGIIKDVLLDRAKSLSTEPKEEALIIIAHGDRNFEPIWERLLRETGAYILGNTGITYFDYAFTGMGEKFVTEALPLIKKAKKERKKVIVLSLYVATGARTIAEMSSRILGRDKAGLKKSIFMDGVVYSPSGLLPSKQLAGWISETSLKILKAYH